MSSDYYFTNHLLVCVTRLSDLVGENRMMMLWLSCELNAH